MADLNPQLLVLLCDQGKFEEAEALVDRYAARIDWEIEQERAEFAARGPREGRDDVPD